MPEQYRYNQATIRKTPWGYQADLTRAGQRFRRTFPGHSQVALAQAKNFIDQIHTEIAAGIKPLTLLEQEQARQAINLLPDGITLLDTVQLWLARNKGITETLTIPAAAERYIEEKIELGKRPDTIRSARSQVRRLAATFKHTNVADLTQADLTAWLARLNLKNALTRNNVIRDVNTFLSWCVDRGLAADNPAAKLPRGAVDDDLPEIYTVDQVRHWFRHLQLHEPLLIPYHALGFFAGIRVTELSRLDHTNLHGHVIHVTPKAAKTRSWRYIEMEPNLQAWLDAYPPHGPIQHAGRTWTDRVRTAAGLYPWTNNVMRHSFATYHLAHHTDAAKTAHDLGHPNANLLYKTYRTLVNTADGTAYFNLLPASPEQLAAQAPPT